MIDGRKTEMSFYHRSGKRIYVWRRTNKSYNVGINGTHLHYTCENKCEAEETVKWLQNMDSTKIQ